ncbi:toll/interleukin-1 receptor domain-containing protein [Candidatus Pacearchaeota archaeon]|nr:toll/interleukin-1 receptor domain-containing protein [Candidatus Pacearchaeota archaeon]
MTHKIFISYATGDEVHIKELYDALSKLKKVDVYIPEWDHVIDVSYESKVKEGINSCSTVIVLLTYNSTNTIWLNQEIGYATAKNIPIIPIVEQGIDVLGFLEGKDYFVFNRSDFGYNIQQVLTRLHSILTI